MSAQTDTASIVRRHIDAVRRWGMPDMVEDYAEDAVILLRGAAIRGKPAIRALFEQAAPIEGLIVDSEIIEGDIAQITYHGDALRFGSDTFLVRDAKIVRQTIALPAGDPAPEQHGRATRADAGATARGWADALTRGKPAQALELLADGIHYEMIGTTPLSGVCEGKAEFLRRVAAVIGAFPQPPVVRCTEVIVEGDRAVVLGSGHGIGPHGSYIQDHYAWVMRVADDRIIEMTEFVDTVALEAAAFGHRLAGPEDGASPC